MIRSRIESLRKGDTRVVERDHVLVLGWNNKDSSILRQLARLQPGVKVVILAPREIDVMQEQLRVAGIHREQIKIILRSGTPADVYFGRRFEVLTERSKIKRRTMERRKKE